MLAPAGPTGLAKQRLVLPSSRPLPPAVTPIPRTANRLCLPHPLPQPPHRGDRGGRSLGPGQDAVALSASVPATEGGKRRALASRVYAAPNLPTSRFRTEAPLSEDPAVGSRPIPRPLSCTCLLCVPHYPPTRPLVCHLSRGGIPLRCKESPVTSPLLVLPGAPHLLKPEVSHLPPLPLNTLLWPLCSGPPASWPGLGPQLPSCLRAFAPAAFSP